MIEDDEIGELLQALEEEMLSSAVRKDAGRLNLLLDEAFTEFGSSGRVYRRAAIIEALQVEAPMSLRLWDFRVVRLADDVVHVTYRSMRGEVDEALRSSVWVRRDARWRMLFHQGTRVPRDSDG